MANKEITINYVIPFFGLEKSSNYIKNTRIFRSLDFICGHVVRLYLDIYLSYV